MLKPREIPQGAEEIKLATNGQFGMVNLCWPLDDSTKAEIEALDGHDKLFIVDPKVEIYFPSFDYFYLKTYRNKNGFTLGELVEKIAKTGYNAYRNWYKGYPEAFDVKDAEEAGATIGENALMSFHQKGNAIYVNVEH
jgi:hypothetical protein